MNSCRTLNVLAATDDSALIRVLDSYNMDVRQIERNGKAIIEEVSRHTPDVLVTETFLQYIDALGVVQSIMQNRSMKKPVIIVLSNTGSSAFEREMTRAGADCCFIRPFEPHIVAQRINMLTENIHGFSADSLGNIDAIISNMLREIGMPAHIKGYPYVRRAIKMCIENEEMMSSVTKILYPAVAKEFNSTPSRVERSIRHAIEAAWDRGDIDVLNSYFGYTIQNDRGKPTNSQFIATLTDSIRVNNKVFR